MSTPVRSTSTALRIGLPAAVFGVIDAVAVASGGRSVPLSVASGALLGGFVAVGLVLRDRFRTRQRKTREITAEMRPEGVGRPGEQRSEAEKRSPTFTAAPLGSWSNPSRRQRVVTRFWERRHDRGQPPPNPLGERRNRR